VREVLRQIINSNDVPPFDTFLELGRAIHDARLDDFIDPAIPGRTNPSRDAKQLVYAAWRHFRNSDEDRIRLEDDKVVKRTLDKLQPDDWLSVRDELVRFSRLVHEELDQRQITPSSSLELAAGGFTYRGRVYDLSGRPYEMLAALLASHWHRMTTPQLVDALKATDTATYPEQVVKDTARKLRQALKAAVESAGLSCPDPLPSKGEGKHLTYCLEVP
jgi:hypothetical protein